MRIRQIGFVAASLLAVSVLTTAGGCSSTITQLEAVDAGPSVKKDGSTTDDDSGLIDEDSGLIETDAGTTNKDGSIVPPTLDGSLGDGSIPPKPDSGPLADGGTCPGMAPTSADLDASGGWKPPAAKQLNACSPANLTTFKNNFATANTYNDLKTGLPAACSSCLFGLEASTNWPLIVTADATGQTGFVNFGACYARGPNGSDACGKAIQYSEFCLTASCADCATSADLNACQSAQGTKSACDTNFAPGIQSGCGTNTANLTALDAACSTVTKGANILCGTGQ